MKHLLTIDFSWQETDMQRILPIMLTLISFIIFWFMSKSAKIKERCYAKYEFDKAAVIHITFNRVLGFITMGVIPAIICLALLPEYRIADLGVTIIPGTMVYTIGWTAGLSLLVIPLAYISARKPKNLVNYPQIRSRKWTMQTIYINALGWALYLLGYEFLFRGILLFPLVNALGVWPAIAINIALYAATHIPKGQDETIGAIPLGLVLCVLTLISGTIWIAVMVHIVMAWTNCFTAMKFHPDIHFVKINK
jgi:membrane protease YdiL (CAAX protease family)